MKNNAFTLSEVLITLGIIGIVAAMTLPTLITNYRKQQTVVKLKQTYSLLNQAIVEAEQVEGDITTWNFGDKHFNSDEARNFIERYIAPYLKTVGKCYKYGCNTKYDLNKKEYPAYLENETHTGRSIYLENGLQIWTYTDSDEDPKIAGIVVDLNGNGNPNLVGIDIFFFSVTNKSNQVLLQGTGLKRTELLNHNGEGCKLSAKNIAGRYCGALIQYDGWKISNDYPFK